MIRKLVMVFLGYLIPLCAVASDVQFGVGVNTSVLGYNQDEISGSRLFWGGHARVRFMRYVAGEVSVQRREDSFSIRQGNIRLKTTPLQVSGIVYPLATFPVSPYFLAGTGWYYLDATVSGDLGLPYVTGEGTISHTENAYHIGAGVEAFIGRHVSLGGDVRKVFLEFDTPVIRYKVDAYMVNVGATFYF